MTVRERFEKIRQDQNNRFSLRTRLIVIVTTEMLFCILASNALDLFLKHVVRLQFDIPLTVELLLMCLIVGILLTSQLSKIFFQPIKRLRSAMGQVAEGDYSVRLDDRSSSKEIMELYSGFNLMTEELSNTEILQTDFVSNVSHEFKTPIGAIEGYSTLLQGCDNLDADQQEYVDKILVNTKRLSSLVGSILLLSRLENQQISTNRSLYRLDEQIRQSIVVLEPMWGPKEIEFEAELDRIEFLGSEGMMRHVWDNLIGNAVKFSPDGGSILLQLSEADGRIRFIIEDHGPGLSEEAQKHLFDKFYQADSSHKQEGNGLGLSLAKRVLTIEGGDIRAENLPRGGCRFTVTLPSK